MESNHSLFTTGEFTTTLKSLGIKLSENPWRGTVIKLVTQSFRDDLARNTFGLADSLLVLDDSLAAKISLFGLREARTWTGALRVIDQFDAIEKTPLFPFKWSRKEERDNLLVESKQAKLKKQEYLDALDEVYLYFKETIFNENLSVWIDSVCQSTTSINRIGNRLVLQEAEVIGNIDVFYSTAKSVIDQLETLIAFHQERQTF